MLARRNSIVALLVIAAVGAFVCTCSPQRGYEKFDIEKLLLAVKPGEAFAGDEVRVGNERVLRLETDKEAEGIRFRTFRSPPFSLALLGESIDVHMASITTEASNAGTLEIYPGVRLGKTTQTEILRRFGRPVVPNVYGTLGYRAIQPVWLVCGFDEDGVMKALTMCDRSYLDSTE